MKIWKYNRRRRRIMIKPEECKDMIEIRDAIDVIDRQIVQLISQRSQYVKNAAKFKKDESAVRDTERIKKVIESKIKLAEGSDASPVLIERLYRTMIDFFVADELKEWEKI